MTDQQIDFEPALAIGYAPDRVRIQDIVIAAGVWAGVTVDQRPFDICAACIKIGDNQPPTGTKGNHG